MVGYYLCRMGFMTRVKLPFRKFDTTFIANINFVIMLTYNKVYRKKKLKKCLKIASRLQKSILQVSN